LLRLLPYLRSVADDRDEGEKMHSSKRARAKAGVIIGVAALLLQGCSLWGLRKDVERLNVMGLVGGHVTRTQTDDAPIVVVLTTGAPAHIVDSFVLERPGAYFFVVPAGTYRIAAFSDRRRDLTYVPEVDPAAYYGAPAEVQVAAGQKIGGLDVSLPAAPGVPLDFSVAAADVGKRGTAALPPVRVGEIVALDDPRFAPENGKLGLWQPVEFLFDVGAGFYFLEPFDAKKVPVLFVHGAGGTPRDWTYLIEHLDRKRFQPWLLYYPSGADLGLIARGAARWMNTVTVRYDVKNLIFVAHSMGGLVSRATINQMVAGGNGGLLKLFVSISSPWNGYGAAAAGVEHSPVVMPMWRDMAPGSPFLADLFRTPLPKTCPYYLFFSYRGHSMVLHEANDGVVPVASELAMSAQQAAVKVWGFDESHVSILRSAAVSETLNGVLRGAVR
jgi:pimeloyl-ACP methyl ester carboxylesterase